jgi:hypothetical protein
MTAATLNAVVEECPRCRAKAEVSAHCRSRTCPKGKCETCAGVFSLSGGFIPNEWFRERMG